MTAEPRLFSGPESETLEFKRSAGDIARHVAAMLNSRGGRIVVGVDEHGFPVGLQAPEVDASEIAARLHAKISPRSPVSVRVEQLDGRAVIVVDVPVGRDRPYVVDGGIYVRLGSATQAATAAQSTGLISPVGAPRWERRPCLGAGLDDLDLERVKEVARRAREQWDVEETDEPRTLLTHFNLADESHLYNGAIVLFGRRPSRFYPQTRVRAVAFARDGAMHDNQVLDGNLFEQVDGMMRFARRNLAVQSTRDVDQLSRQDSVAVPLDVLREAFLNALVHRDYDAYSGGVSLQIDQDGLEIWNAGELPEGMALSDLERGHASRPRNPDIAHVVFLMGLIERFGIGTQFIASAYADAPARPSWRLDSGGVRLSLPLLDTGARSLQLNTRQLALLAELPLGGLVTTAEYARRYAAKVSERQARADLAALTEASLLTRIGSGPSTRYERTERSYSGMPPADG